MTKKHDKEWERVTHENKRKVADLQDENQTKMKRQEEGYEKQLDRERKEAEKSAKSKLAEYKDELDFVKNELKS